MFDAAICKVVSENFVPIVGDTPEDAFNRAKQDTITAKVSFKSHHEVIKAIEDLTFESYLQWVQAEKVKKMEGLLIEARELILAVGESDHVPIQFPQHGWLKEVNELLPPTE